MSKVLPPSLVRFGEELERAIDLEIESSALARTPRRRAPQTRRQITRFAAIGVCTAAAVTALAILLTAGGSRQSPWSRHVLRAAEFALPAADPHTIIHVSITQTMDAQARRGSGNPAAILTAQGWFQQGGSRRSVTEETIPGRGTIWQADSRLYDAATHRVYVMPQLPNGHPHYVIVTHGADSTLTLRVDGPHGLITQTITAAEARALRAGTDQVFWAETWNGHRARLQPLIGPRFSTIKAKSRQQPDQVSLTFSAQLHRLLQSGRAQVDGHSTVDGQAAIKIALPGVDNRPFEAYYVDARTYAPIEFDLYGAGKLTNRTRVVFHSYDRLPLRGNQRVLRLPVPTGTRVVNSATQYFRHDPPPIFIW